MKAAHRLRLAVRPGRFAVVRLPARARLPRWALNGPFHSITRTAAELSIVCRESRVPKGVRREDGFRCLQVRGPFA
ncbi:MAG: ACT domain-containing protein, partial [Acidobacteriota bacterium]